MATSTPVQVQKQMQKMMLLNFVFMFAGLALLFIISDPGIRNPLGKDLNVVFMPLLGFNYAFPIITIVLTGIVIGLLASIPRYFFTDWVKMGKAQMVSKAYSKAMREAMREGDNARVKKLQKMQMERQADQMVVQMNTMKPLFVMEIFFFLIIIWIYVFILSLKYQYVSMPWDYNLNIVTTHAWLFPLWIVMYMIADIVVGYFVTMIMKYFDFSVKIKKLERNTIQKAD